MSGSSKTQLYFSIKVQSQYSMYWLWSSHRGEMDAPTQIRFSVETDDITRTLQEDRKRLITHNMRLSGVNRTRSQQVQKGREQGRWMAWGFMVFREGGQEESSTELGACAVWTSCQCLRREGWAFLISLPRCGSEGKREEWGSHRKNGVSLFGSGRMYLCVRLLGSCSGDTVILRLSFLCSQHLLCISLSPFAFAMTSPSFLSIIQFAIVSSLFLPVSDLHVRKRCALSPQFLSLTLQRLLHLILLFLQVIF